MFRNFRAIRNGDNGCHVVDGLPGCVEGLKLGVNRAGSDGGVHTAASVTCWSSFWRVFSGS